MSCACVSGSVSLSLPCLTPPSFFCPSRHPPISACNVSNTYQKFVANTCKLKCAIYTEMHKHTRPSPLQTHTRSHSCHLFGIVVFVAHVRGTCSCFLPRPLHIHSPPLKSLAAWPPKFAHFNTSKRKNKRRLFSAIFLGLGNTQF